MSGHEPRKETPMQEVELFHGLEEPRPVFDYEDAGEDAPFLREIERRIRDRIARAWLDTAADIKAAHDRLASHGREGTFTRWAASHGMTRDYTARMIRRYDFVVRHSDNRETLLSLPLTVLDEAARPDTPAELVTAVCAGQVKTRKQAKAMRGDEPPATLDENALYTLLRKAERETESRRATRPDLPPEQSKEAQKIIMDMLTPDFIRNMMKKYSDPMNTARGAAKTAPQGSDPAALVKAEWGIVLTVVNLCNDLSRALRRAELDLTEAYRKGEYQAPSAAALIERYEYDELGIAPETRETLLEYLDAGAFDALTA